MTWSPARGPKRHEDLIGDLKAILDVDAGLADILDPRLQHTALLETIQDQLDISAGLADITAPTLVAEDLGPDAERCVSVETWCTVVTQLDGDDPLGGGIVAVTTSGPATDQSAEFHPLDPNRSLSDAERLSIRTHHDYPRLVEALELLVEPYPFAELPKEVRSKLDLPEAVTIAATHPSFAQRYAGWIQGIFEVLLVSGGDHRAIEKRILSLSRGETRGSSLTDEIIVQHVVPAICDLASEVLGDWALRGASGEDAVLALNGLRSLTLDFSGADLCGVDLSGCNLEGVLWSTRTRWPEDWTATVAEFSEKVAADLFQVRYGGVLLGVRPL